MKNVLLDTDIGVDCDDAVALALLLKLEREGKCRILGVTVSTTREGASASVEAICRHYGTEKPIGVMRPPALTCDRINAYSLAVKQKYHTDDVDRDAVDLMREKLAAADGPVTLIAIGPQTNVCRLLKSGADGWSELDGKELVRRKVDCLWVMGGSFKENYGAVGLNPSRPICEWNIVQDVASAQYVAENFPCETVFSPHEAGSRIFTVMRDEDSPVWYSMLKFAEYNAFPVKPDFLRESWDPVTCLAALEDCSDYFDISGYGSVSVAASGETSFRAGDGRQRILLVKGGFSRLSDRINAMIE